MSTDSTELLSLAEELREVKQELWNLQVGHAGCLPREGFVHLLLYALPFSLVATTATLSAVHPTIADVVVAVLSALVATWSAHHRFQKWWGDGGDFIAFAVGFLGAMGGFGLGPLLATGPFNLRI